MMLSGKSGGAATHLPKASMRSPTAPALSPTTTTLRSPNNTAPRTPLSTASHVRTEPQLQQELERAHRREEQLRAEMQSQVNATILESERRHWSAPHAKTFQLVQAQWWKAVFLDQPIHINPRGKWGSSFKYHLVHGPQKSQDGKVDLGTKNKIMREQTCPAHKAQLSLTCSIVLGHRTVTCPALHIQKEWT